MSPQANRDLRLLAYELGRAFGERRALPELISFAVATCRDLLAAESVAILLLDREGDELYFPYLAEEDPRIATQLSSIRFPAGQGVAGKVLRTARSVRVDDVGTERSFFAGVDRKTKRKTRSILCAPLTSSHGAIGVIEAVNPRRAECFTDEDVALLDALAPTIAAAIANTQQHETAVADEAPRSSRSPGSVEAVPAPRTQVFRRHGEYWTITYVGETVRLKDAKGLSYIAQLLRHPEQAFHAIDLVNAIGGEHDESSSAQAAAEERRRNLGDAGEMLDTHAIAEYKRQLADLRDELAGAEGCHDLGRIAALRQEIEFLTREITRAVGLGGRSRRAGSHVERARVNVTRAISSALRKIAEHHDALGRHLEATIKTGTFCSYVPDPRMPVEWVL